MREPEPLWCVCGHANYQHPITSYPVGPNKLPEERSDCEECEECEQFEREHTEHVHYALEDITFPEINKVGKALTPEGNKRPTDEEKLRVFEERREQELEKSKDLIPEYEAFLKKRGYKPEVPTLPNRAARRKTARQIKRQMKRQK